MNGGLYVLLNQARPSGARPTPSTALDDVIPFLPWTTWPYLVLFSLSFVVPLVPRGRRAFGDMMRAYVVAISANFAIWIGWPTFMPRPVPPTGDDLTSSLYRAFMLVDTNHNALPSGHLTIPIVCAWGATLDRPRWRAPLVALLVVLAPSVLTTKQHAVPDLVAGVATALVGIGAAKLWRHRQDGHALR
jgi:hypothetical protein